MTKKLIAANWKMNKSFDEADEWMDKFLLNTVSGKPLSKKVEVVVCPTNILIDYINLELMDGGFHRLEEAMDKEDQNVEDLLSEDAQDIFIDDKPFKLGAQNCHHEVGGSYTGDVSAKMLKDAGAEYVILGHSERRAACRETNEVVAAKVRSAVREEMIPIICVGEDKLVRDENKHLEYVYKQIMLSVPQDIKIAKLVIAYEPIWSIGTGVVPVLEQIAEMGQFITRIINEKLQTICEEHFILYGGSVTSQNCAEILAIPTISGLLVGKASLDADEFYKICSTEL